MLQIGIDQFTLILFPSEEINDFDSWRNYQAIHIIDQFLVASKILQLFENFGVSDKKLPEGYTNGYSFKNASFYWAIAYHEAFIKMGVIVKFSAHSWACYQKQYENKFGEKIHLHTFLKLIKSKEYTFRLSRVDPYVDFFNENIDIARLKKSLEEGRTEIRYGKR